MVNGLIGVAEDSGSASLYFHNNIVNAGAGILYHYAGVDLDVDYNTYTGELNAASFRYDGNNKTFAEWQALGQDAHSTVV